MKKKSNKAKTDKKPFWIFLLIGLLIVAMLIRTFKPNTVPSKVPTKQTTTTGK